MYKEDLAFKNVQGLICHKNQPTNQANIVSVLQYIPTIRNLIIINITFNPYIAELLMVSFG